MSFQSHISILKNKFTIIMEIWLSDDNDFALELNGYKSVSVYRNDIGGGIKLFFLDHVNISLINTLISSKGRCESFSTRANILGFGYLIITEVYRRPPHMSVPNF